MIYKVEIGFFTVFCKFFFVDLPANTKSPVDAAWNLLQKCLTEYEEDKMTVLHKVVCKQIIKMNMWVPYWLQASYKVAEIY